MGCAVSLISHLGTTERLSVSSSSSTTRGANRMQHGSGVSTRAWANNIERFRASITGLVFDPSDDILRFARRQKRRSRTSDVWSARRPGWINGRFNLLGIGPLWALPFSLPAWPRRCPIAPLSLVTPRPRKSLLTLRSLSTRLTRRSLLAWQALLTLRSLLA